MHEIQEDDMIDKLCSDHGSNEDEEGQKSSHVGFRKQGAHHSSLFVGTYHLSRGLADQGKDHNQESYELLHQIQLININKKYFSQIKGPAFNMRKLSEIAQTFRLTCQFSSITVTKSQSALKVLSLDHREGIVYTSYYDKRNLPATSKCQFSSIDELYLWLQKFKTYPQSWLIRQERMIITFAQDNVLQMALSKSSDFNEIMSAVVQEVVEIRKEQQDLTRRIFQQVNQSHQKEAETVKRIENRINEIVQRNETKDRKTQQRLEDVEDKVFTLEDKIEKQQVTQDHNYESKDLKEAIQSLEDNFQSLKKKNDNAIKQQKKAFDEETYEYRNALATLKAELKVVSEESKKARADFKFLMERDDLDRMKRDIQMINEAFENQLRIRPYAFEPDPRCLENNKNIIFLNKNTLKCMQEVKDYVKIISKTPLSKGRHAIRILVKNIKNNGLMFGVCTNKIKDSLELASFNDSNIISINSCGYLVNRGLMSTFNGKIKSGDIVRMIVSLPMGEIRWFCNDMELAVADAGPLATEQLIPLIGLGNFIDQVQLVEHDERSKMQQNAESYTRELTKLNMRFGKRGGRI